MIYSRRALLALFAALALSSAAGGALAAPDAPEAPPAIMSPLRARRAEREAEKEAAAAAPAPAMAKKAKNATAAGAAGALPASGKENTKYFVNARSALYSPAAKGSDKPGTLKLEGVVPTVLGEVRSTEMHGAESLVGRVTAAQLFGKGGKQRLPVFDKKDGGLDVVLMGDRGKNATSLFLVLSNPRGFKEGKDASVEFDAAPLSQAKEEADTASDVIAVQGLANPARIADATNGQKVRLEQVVSVIAAYSPHGDATLKRAKEVAAGTYEKPKVAAKKEKAEKKKDAAEAPSPAPLAEKAGAAKDKVVEKAKDAKDKVAEAVGRKMLTFADLNPSGRRLLQDDKNCGICEYVDKSGACQVAPASMDCDGIVGMSGEWACGTCETFTWNDWLGYCETVPGC